MGSERPPELLTPSDRALIGAASVLTNQLLLWPKCCLWAIFSEPVFQEDFFIVNFPPDHPLLYVYVNCCHSDALLTNTSLIRDKLPQHCKCPTNQQRRCVYTAAGVLSRIFPNLFSSFHLHRLRTNTSTKIGNPVMVPMMTNGRNTKKLRLILTATTEILLTITSF